MKKLLGIVVLGLFLGGCATAPVVVDQINSVDPNYYKKKYFDGKELSKVEGIWRWMNGNYKVAIIKNDLGVEPTFEYLGIIIDVSTFGAATPPGSIKLKLNKSTNPNVYVGNYVVTDGMTHWDKGTTFLVEKDLITTSVSMVGKVAMVKMYPAGKSTASKSSAKKKSEPSAGSAFFINDSGYIITNYHVVEGCNNKSKIIYKTKEYETKLIAKDDYLDLALLKAEINNNDFIIMSNKPPKKLQRIIAAGYQFGKYLSDDMKFTSGIISSLKGAKDDSTRLQIDAALNPGSSGGPIVDENTGELVAVAVSGLRKDISEAINFGIKAGSVKNFLESNQINVSTSAKKYGSENIGDLLEKTVLYTFCK